MVTSKTEIFSTEPTPAVVILEPEVEVTVEPNEELEVDFEVNPPGLEDEVGDKVNEEDSIKEESDSNEENQTNSRNSEVISPSSLSVPQKVQFFEEFSKDSATLYAPQAPVLIA